MERIKFTNIVSFLYFVSFNIKDSYIRSVISTEGVNDIISNGSYEFVYSQNIPTTPLINSPEPKGNFC